MCSRAQQELIEKLRQRHKCFSKQEVKDLVDFFETQLEKRRDPLKFGGLDQDEFGYILLNTFDMTEHVFPDGVFKAFAKRNCDVIDLDDWMDGMAVFLRGTLEEKTKLCFQVYDSNSDGFIEKEDICELLEDSIVPKFYGKDSTNIITALDCDQDNKISFEDFKESVKKENLLLEAFGPCLPEHQGMLKSDKETTFFPV
uniref:calaxin-like isoform X2 n=1 Tax=Myxine glutinosa TaxID=7769 RepID=UPI0035902CC0